MAEDERQASAVLEESSRIHPSTERLEVAESTLVEVERSVATAEALAAQAVLTADDVLRLALHIEGSTLKRLDQVWIQGFGPMFSGLLQELAPDAEVRTRCLIEAIHAFGTAPSLRAEVSSLWALH
jgi:hypothetical protein